MYVVIEGIDTAGKSTQLDLLKKKLPNAIFTKEPGGTTLGLKLRTMALNGEAKSKIAEMFLFMADRAEHIEEVIKNNKNNTIISDRSMISGIAYASTLSIDELINLNLIFELYTTLKLNSSSSNISNSSLNPVCVKKKFFFHKGLVIFHGNGPVMNRPINFYLLASVKSGYL